MELVAPRFEDAFISLLGGIPKESLAQPAGGAVSTPSAGPVIEAERLTKRFGRFTAADSVTFSVNRGEIFGLLGPNGAGKSTTFKMMCGLLRPTSGRARVVGLDLASAPSEGRAKLGYMAQKFSLYGDLSVRQNLDFFAGVYGLDGQRRREATAQVIAEHGLGPYLSESAGMLPLGFKQRLALSCAVMHRPPVLFLDEPTSGVDPRTRREFWLRIQGMVETGVTVLVTTHFMDEAEYCDRIALIYRGRLIALDTPDDLKGMARSEADPEPTMEDAFIHMIEEFDRHDALATAAGGRSS
jgi:ABC-type multidrug transport system ATPase subunit